MFGNFVKILQSFAMRLGLQINIQIFILKVSSDIQSFLQKTSAQFSESAQFSKIQKYNKNYDLSVHSLNDSLSLQCHPFTF